MSKLAVLIVVVTIIAGTPVVVLAQSEANQPPAQSQHAQAPDTTNPEAKRGISEEGGMKASGPSQAKGGESR